MGRQEMLTYLWGEKLFKNGNLGDKEGDGR
jgi:hypothetical protein